MGQSRFKLSHLVPSSWFYRPKNNTGTSDDDHHRQEGRHICQVHDDHHQYYSKPVEDGDYVPTRASYYFSSKERLPLSPVNRKLSDTHFPKDSPRKSVGASSSPPPSSSSSTPLPPPPPSKSRIIARKPVNGHCIEFKDLEILSELKLPPILTKPVKKEAVIHQRSKGPAASMSTAVLQSRHKMLIADSLVVIKPSADPRGDFRESMVEMIVENEIRAPEDLEELLACYLSLNSREYHGTILKVFKQIWFDLKLGLY